MSLIANLNAFKDKLEATIENNQTNGIFDVSNPPYYEVEVYNDVLTIIESLNSAASGGTATEETLNSILDLVINQLDVPTSQLSVGVDDVKAKLDLIKNVLDSINTNGTQLNTKVDNTNNNIDAVRLKIEAAETVLNSILDLTIDQLDISVSAGIDDIKTDLDLINNALDSITTNGTQLNTKVDSTNNSIDVTRLKIEAVENTLNEVKNDIISINSRIDTQLSDLLNALNNQAADTSLVDLLNNVYGVKQTSSVILESPGVSPTIVVDGISARSISAQFAISDLNIGNVKVRLEGSNNGVDWVSLDINEENFREFTSNTTDIFLIPEVIVNFIRFNFISKSSVDSNAKVAVDIVVGAS